MCDWSLHAEITRLGVEGETLITHRFSCGTVGLASLADRQAHADWSAKKSLGDCSFTDKAPVVCAVCIPPGARLSLPVIPRWVQERFAVQPDETATFEQLGPEVETHRDGVRFSNRQFALVHELGPGIMVQVVSLEVADEPQSAIWEDVPVLVRAR